MKLSKTFLLELFRLLFLKKDIADVCVEHLKYEYLPNQEYKKIWKSYIKLYQNTGKIPSIGIVSQQLSDDDKVQELIGTIKDLDIPDKEGILTQLEAYIKDSMSVEVYDRFGEIYNKGDRDGARKVLRDFAEQLGNFSIKRDIYYETIFDSFENRIFENQLRTIGRETVRDKLPFSIDEIDDLTGGGMDIGDTACLLMRSGVGKTKALRWVGVGAARRGFKVLHIQAEGTKRKCLDGYDATWTAQPAFEIAKGELKDPIFNKLKKSIKDISNLGGEIFVHSFEQFNQPSMTDVRNQIIDLIKIHGHIDLVLFDYLELFSPGDGIKYHIGEERHRRQAVARKMKNIAVEFNTRVMTATQADNVGIEDWNNPNFCMTRNNVSECKSLIDSFSFFFTGNQTKAEKDGDVMRIYLDKLRDYYSPTRPIHIYQNYKYDRFYDRKRTLQNFYKRETEE